MKSLRHARRDRVARRAAEDAKKAAEEWQWGSKDELRDTALSLLNGADYDRKKVWVDDIVNLSDRVLKKRHEAAVHTTSAHWFDRASAGFSAAVATLTGGALIGQLGGTAAVIVGISAAAVGVVGAMIAAAKPGASYAIDLARKAQYEQLWWDIRAYSMTKLPSASPDDFEAAMNGFSARESTIMAASPPNQAG
jgi:hypothetical protein